MIRRVLLIAVLLLWPGVVLAQQDGVLQINDPIHQFLMRQQTRGLLPEAHLSHQPLSAYEAHGYLDSLAVREDRLTAVDRRLLRRFRGEETHRGAAWVNRHAGFLYGNGQDFLSVAGDDYALQLNPMAYLTAGQAWRTTHDGEDRSLTTWQNTRGIRASGHITRHIFFEGRIEENQRRVVWPHVEKRTSPRLDFNRLYPESGAYDYWRAMGLVGFRSRYFEVRLGKDHNRWSHGVNSLFLSNFAPAYDQLQIRTTVWRVQYTNLFTALENLGPLPDRFGDQIIPRKYASMHRLEIAVHPRLQVDLFETVVFATDPHEESRRTGYELGYLNPFIFYRAVELARGSPDNVLLGAGLNWTSPWHTRLYAQGLISEFKIEELRARRGWWANKYGFIVGAHTVNWPLPDLDFGFEVSRVEPYTYSHSTHETSFVHHDDVLGHPAGQNFIDWMIFAGYRPLTDLSIWAHAARTVRGRDTDEENWGGDPRLPNRSRVRSYGVHILQGIRQQQTLVEAGIAYELLPRLFLEGSLRAEMVDDAETGLNRYVNPFITLRWGLPYQSVRY